MVYDKDMNKSEEKPVKQDKEERPERVFAFIDSQNLNVSTQKFGWKMDWQKCFGY